MWRLPRYPLVRLLDRDSNNLDLIRLVCACLVIFGHAAVVVHDPRHPFGDPLSRWLNYEGVYSGSIAVRIFFFISGLLVTDSLLRKRSAGGFILGRNFRVWPALIALLVATVYLIGPLVSSLTPAEYFADPATHRYLRDNLLLLFLPHSYLPGVFVDNPHPIQINASLWTLTYEIGCYTTLLVLFVLKVLSRPWLCIAVASFILMEALLPQSLIFPGMDDNFQVRYLPLAFAMGALMAVFKEHVTLGPEALLVAAVLFLALKSTVVGQHLFFILLFLTSLYVSGLPWVRKLRLRADLSYGTYLWGFLVQQILASQFSELGYGFNLFWSLTLSVSVAALSWHLLEKHAIEAGHRWSKSLR